MKNGKIRFIPLQAELCLNKQKVDITDFNGWQKCNAPVYGDCLSPLYTKKDTHHDIYIGNDTYDFSQGKLYKNGNEVLSGVGSKKIKKTKINENYDCIAISEEGNITGAKIISATSIAISIEGRPFTTFDMSFYDVESILTVKAYSNSEYDSHGIMVLVRDTSSRLMLFWWTITDIGRANYTYVDNTFEVINPFIQVMPINANGDIIVSVFSNSGANISNVDVRNYYLEVNEYNYELIFNEITGFTDDSQIPHRYRAVDDSVGINVNVETNVKTGTSITTSNTSSPVLGLSGLMTATSIEIIEQTITIMLDKAVSYPISVALKYLKPDGTYAQGTNESFTISAGATRYTRKFTFMDYITNIGASGSSITYTLNPSITINNNGTTTTPTVQNNTALVYPCYVANINGKLMSTFNIVTTVQSDKNPNNATTPQELVATNRTFPSSITDGTKFSLKGMTFVTKTTPLDYMQLSGVNVEQGITTLQSAKTEVPSTFPEVLLTTPLSRELRYNGYNVTTYSFATPFLPYMTLNNFPLFAASTNKAFYSATDNPYDKVYRYLKEEYTGNVFGNVDCCMDNGLLYCCKGLDVDTDTPMPTQAFALAGEFGSFVDDGNNKGHVVYGATSVFDVSYDAIDEENVFPKYYDGLSLSLGVGLFKGMYQFKAQKDSEDKIYIMIDSLAMEEGEDASHLYPGVLQGSDYNYQGSVKNTYGVNGWRLLFNNNIISNIGCYEQSNWIGTILADWFTIDEKFSPTYNHSTLIYKDTSNNIWRLDLVDSGQDWDYRFIENRYIVLNTNNYFNCYDVVTGMKRHWASDYNNRIVFGYAFKKYTNDETFKALLTTALFRGLTITGQNPNYEMTQDYITGLELGALLYEKCLIDYKAFLSCDVPYDAIETIDIYRGDNGSTSAIYIESYKNGLRQINVDLTNPYAGYPISQNGDIRYNPNLFSQFIKSYNNSDMVLSDGVAYRLQYFNNVTPVMAFYMLDGVEGLDNAFVLQTIYYGVSPTRLYEMVYNNGASVNAVADITNLEYLGALPSQALFWSAQNRAIYTFRGNCILTLTQYANDLEGIYGKWYNPATQELFLDTNIGLLVFSDLGTYCIEWDTPTTQRSVEDMFFFKDRFLINFLNDTSYTYYYSYNNLEGYESNKVIFLTKYYGNGLVPITVNNIYIRLYNQGVANAKGSIKFKGYTITDIGTSTDEKTIEIGGVDDPTANPPEVAGEAWDATTDTMLVKYTPQYNRGLGFALSVESTFPIIDIKFDYVENGSVESQIGHINI